MGKACERVEIATDENANPQITVELPVVFAAVGFTQTPPPFIETALPGNAFAGVVPAPNGRLYGLTYTGGTSNKGTLYSVDTAMSALVVHVNFNGSNGATPFDELTYDVASAKFYGTTSSGGAGNIGTIFSFDPATNTPATLKDDFLGYAQPQGAARGIGRFHLWRNGQS